MRAILSFLAVALLFASCKKEKPEETVEVTSGVHTNFYATIDNKPWDANISAYRVENGRLIIAATPENGTLLQFELPSTKLGTYIVSDTSVTDVLFSNDSADYTGKHVINPDYYGKIILSKYDTATKKISGTFELVLANTINKRMITIEDGHFTDVALGIPPQGFVGDTLCMTWLNTLDKQGLFYMLRNQANGEIAYRKIVGSRAFQGGVNSCRSPLGRYMCFPNKGVGGLYDIPTYQELKLFVADTFHDPVVVHDKFYYFRSSRGVFELDPFVGETHEAESNAIHLTNVFKSPSMTTDGTFLYVFDGKNFQSVLPTSGANVVYDVPSDYVINGMEYTENNKFLTIRTDSSASTVKFKLAQVQIGAALKVTLTDLVDLQQDKSPADKISFCTTG